MSNYTLYPRGNGKSTMTIQSIAKILGYDKGPKKNTDDKETYYLVESDGRVHSKFEVTKRDSHYINGECYNCISWESDNTPYEYEFVAGVYCKWDSCTHWYFRGEDYEPELQSTDHDGVDAYYHLCGSYSFLSHIRAMCFVWKLAEQLMTESGTKYIKNEYYDTPEIKALIDMMLKDFTILKGEKHEL